MDIQISRPAPAPSAFLKKRSQQLLFQGASPRLSHLQSDQVRFSGEGSIDPEQVKARSLAAKLQVRHQSALAQHRAQLEILEGIKDLQSDDLKQWVLWQALKVRSVESRCRYAGAITSIQSDAPKEKVILQVLEDRDGEVGLADGYTEPVRLIATEAIQSISSDTIKVSLIQKALKTPIPPIDSFRHPEEQVHYLAIKAIASIKSDDLKVKLIEQLLDDPDLYIRKWTTEVFASVKSDILRDKVVQKGLKDSSMFVREGAALVAGTATDASES